MSRIDGLTELRRVPHRARRGGAKKRIELPSPATMTSQRPDSELHLDATGLLCPEPLMLMRNRVREMRSGQVLHVIATDPSTGRDFSNFCRFMGHELIDQDQLGEVFHYRIRKG